MADEAEHIHGRIAALVPYEDVTDVVATLAREIPRILGDRLTAFYLTGSLTYGDFDPGSSDIDYLVVMEREIDAKAREELAMVHAAIGERHPAWRTRIEGSYITRDMLASVEPPLEGRPYVNGGAFWHPDPPYGHEWLVNLYAVRACGVALHGPPPAELIPPVDTGAVREASLRDLQEEWLPQLDDPGFPPDAHHEAYVTMTLCRILHRAASDEVVSKREAAAWAKERLGEPWRSLIERAEGWQHGEELHDRDHVRAFLRYVAGAVTT